MADANQWPEWVSPTERVWAAENEWVAHMLEINTMHAASWAPTQAIMALAYEVRLLRLALTEKTDG